MQQPTATFSQTEITVQLVADSIDGVIDDRGWAIYPEITNQTAVFETANDVGLTEGTVLTFTLIQAFPHFDSLPGHTLGRFRLSVTTDARDTLADGLASGGDVTATWTVLAPYSLRSANGTVLTNLPDLSILASGDIPGPTDTYTVSAITTLTNITGIRLEALQHASLPQNGPGRYRNGNFVLSEFLLDASVANTPPSFTLGSALTVPEEFGPLAISNWANNISPSTPPGNSDEAGQTVQFIVSNDNPSLFSAQPAITPDGTLRFTPAPNACGSANVTVVASDNGGTDFGGRDTSAPQSFTITILCANDCPTANPLSTAAAQRGQVNFQLPASDPDGDALQYLITQAPAHGIAIVQAQTGAASYAPSLAYCGPDSFKYRVNDGRCDSAEATVSITVDCITNRCPTAVATVSPSLSIECVGLSNVVIAANNTEACVVLDGSSSSDPDGDALTFSWSVNGEFTTSLTAQGARATSCLALGSHEICLTVSDGQCSDTTCVIVEVISPCQSLGALIAQVESSGLPRSRQRPLIATLKAACASFDDGTPAVGVNQLEAFQNKVAAQVAPTDAALSQQLIDCAEAIIDALSGP